MNSRSHHPWADVAIFENLNDGRLLETFLRDKDIDARAYHNKWFQGFLFLRPPHVTWRIQVRADQYVKAEQLLELHQPPLLEKAIHCPSCGSLHVNYPQMTRKFLLPSVLLHLGIIFRVIGHECYCEHCHLTWNLPQDMPAKVRAARPAFPFK